jgi:hypothetical protein
MHANDQGVVKELPDLISLGTRTATHREELQWSVTSIKVDALEGRLDRLAGPAPWLVDFTYCNQAGASQSACWPCAQLICETTTNVVAVHSGRSPAALTAALRGDFKDLPLEDLHAFHVHLECHGSLSQQTGRQ